MKFSAKRKILIFTILKKIIVIISFVSRIPLMFFTLYKNWGKKSVKIISFIALHEKRASE